MPADITVRVADDASPIEVLTAVHVAVTGLDPWEADATQDDPFQTRQDVYYLAATVAGDDHSYESPRFTPSHDNGVDDDENPLPQWEWDGFVFPSDGSWTLTLWRVGTGREGDDESIATQAVTVAVAS